MVVLNDCFFFFFFQCAFCRLKPPDLSNIPAKEFFRSKIKKEGAVTQRKLRQELLPSRCSRLRPGVWVTFLVQQVRVTSAVCRHS